VPDDVAQLGYLAGIVDGEGTIARQAPMVAVIMTCERTIDWLAQFGGQKLVLSLRPLASGVMQKQQWRWHLTGSANVHLFLTTIEPYMVTKREQAMILISELEQRPGFSMPRKA
jgi:anti-sigma-K factor RskA